MWRRLTCFAALCTLVNAFQLANDKHRVKGLTFGNGKTLPESYAGHFDIRTFDTPSGADTGKTGMFYWFFPAIDVPVEEAPLLVWLQGGPGSSSMLGLFYEMGPITVDNELKLAENVYSWARNYSMIFVDQPVGTGFSYVRPKANVSAVVEEESDFVNAQDVKSPSQDDPIVSTDNPVSAYSGQRIMSLDENAHRNFGRHNSYEQGYVTNQFGAMNDFLSFMAQFYETYPELKKNKLYLTGESYAGKYVPAFGYAIHMHNERIKKEHKADSFLIPLEGLVIGNGLTDPISEIQVHGELAFYLGLVDRLQADEINAIADRAVQQIRAGNFSDATDTRVEIFKLYNEYTGGVNWYDVRKGDVQYDYSYMNKFMNLASTKESLNVDQDLQYDNRGAAVAVFMKNDICQSVAHLLPTLLKHYKVMLFQGQYDYRDGVAANWHWITNIKWSGQKQFLKEKREIWRVNGRVAGWVRKYEQLTLLSLYGAGHLAPMDQPLNTFQMITNFIQDRPWA